MKILKWLQAFILFFIVQLAVQCQSPAESKTNIQTVHSEIEAPVFGMEEASLLLDLPLTCYNQEFPYKLGQVLESPSDLKTPRELHPIFYGCFDWHSAVHGYWSMVVLVKHYPDLPQAAQVRSLLKQQFTAENVQLERAYFAKEINKSFERMYGWSWLLKLAEELYMWDDDLGRELASNLQPLTDLILIRYKEFLPLLNYPIRVGEHTNTAFGMSFAYDYAKTVGEEELQFLIGSRARDFYADDRECPLAWEPSGYDLLSPCFEEINLMRRVLDSGEFLNWMQHFMPALESPDFKLLPAQVSDRTDGKLVHLDGLNFSRAWTLYALANSYSEYKHLQRVADAHIQFSLPNLVGDTYEGGHWLGSFAIYALLERLE